MRARASQPRQKRVVAVEPRVGLVDVARARRGPRPTTARSTARSPSREDVAGPDAAALDAERHVGLQPDRLPGAGGVGGVAVVADERPLGRRAAVVEHRLADQLDLDLALDALDGAHQHVVGVVVGRRPGVRRDRVLAAARPHGQRVAHDDPAARACSTWSTRMLVPGS